MATSQEGAAPVPADAAAAAGWEERVSAYSKAGIATAVFVQLTKRLRLLFDVGVCLDEHLGANHVFVSHGHTDHVGAIVCHARAAGLSGLKPVYYVPAAIADSVAAYCRAAGEMDGGAIQMKVVVVQDGETVELGKGVRVTAFATRHRVASQGYLVTQRHNRGLREEYQGLEGAELKALRMQGTELSRYEEVVEVCYTGDTVFEALLEHRDLVFQARLLIMEASFLGPRKTVPNAVKLGHVHLDEVVAHSDAFKAVECLYLVHFSNRYGPKDIIQRTQDCLPPELQRKTLLALQAFGQPDRRVLREEPP